MCVELPKSVCLCCPMLTDHHFKATPLLICSSVIPVKWHLKVWKRMAPAETQRGGKRAAKATAVTEQRSRGIKGFIWTLYGPMVHLQRLFMSSRNANTANSPWRSLEILLLAQSYFLQRRYTYPCCLKTQLVLWQNKTLRKKEPKKKPKAHKAGLDQRRWWDVSSPFLKTSPPYIPTLAILCFEQTGFCWRWLNTLDLLSEFLWPRNTEPAMDHVSITGSLIQPLITRSKMHWKREV